MKRLAIFLAIGATALNLSAQVRIYDSGDWTNICLAAQKPGGGLTAAGVGDWHQWNWNENWQPTYNNSPWNRWGSSDTARGNPASMERLNDGSVVSLWNQKNDGTVFCLIHDNNSFGANVCFANMHGPAADVRVFADTQTNFWITEAGLNIYFAPARLRNYHQTPKLVYAITPDKLCLGGDPTNCLPLSIAEDARGRIWFWSNCLLGGNLNGQVRGVLIYENGVVTNYAKLDGVKTGLISVLAPMNQTNLWLAVRYKGMFAVDLETLRGSPVAEPEPGAFQVVQQIFKDGEDIYVITGARGGFETVGRKNCLWRQRAGVWKKIVSGLDSAGSSKNFAARHWLFTKEGLWLGAFGTGGWFVPRDDGEPRQIAWQVGSPFDSIDRWFQLKNGQLVALQFGRGGFIADPSLLTAPEPKSTAQVLDFERPPIQSPDGKIFAILREDKLALSEWDGKAWRRHPFPDDIQQLRDDCRIIADANGCIWFINPTYDQQLSLTLIYDPAAGKFRRFSTFQSAIQTQAVPLAGTRLGDADAPNAIFSTDGRIAWLGDGDVPNRIFSADGHALTCWFDTELHYFDGHEWRSWKDKQIDKSGAWGGWCVSFFDGEGKLTINLNGKFWRLDDLAGWQNTQQPAPKISDGLAPVTAEIPNVSETNSLVADQRGGYWFTAHRQLYRAAYGLRTAVFPPNEPQPFADGRELTGALVDNWGNTFLQTRLHGREETVLVPASKPLPVAKVKLRENTVDRTVFELSLPGVVSPRFVWRLDGGAWSDAMTNTLLRLDDFDLDPGKHHVEVLALDDRLEPSPAPAVWKFQVRDSIKTRIQQQIAQLGGADYSRREAAVAWLSRHRAWSLPALAAALEHERTADRRWWLQAAIQQCQ